MNLSHTWGSTCQIATNSCDQMEGMNEEEELISTPSSSSSPSMSPVVLPSSPTHQSHYPRIYDGNYRVEFSGSTASIRQSNQDFGGFEVSYWSSDSFRNTERSNELLVSQKSCELIVHQDNVRTSYESPISTHADITLSIPRGISPGRRHGREQMRFTWSPRATVSHSIHVNKLQRVRMSRVTKNHSLKEKKQYERIGDGLRETFLFSLSAPCSPSTSSDCVQLYSTSSRPTVERSPHWISAAKRALIRSRKERNRFRGSAFTLKGGLHSIKEEESEEDVSGAIDDFAKVNLIEPRGDIRNTNSGGSIHLSIEQLGINDPNKPSTSKAHIVRNMDHFEDEICSRLYDLPMVEKESSTILSLGNRMQLLNVDTDYEKED